MTIKYSLTQAEIVRSFFRSLVNAPKFAGMILAFLFGLGLLRFGITAALAHEFTLREAGIALAWTVGLFFFIPIWLFISGKTSERTLTTSPEGISTEIGSLKGQVLWSKVKVVTDAGRFVLVVGITGNAFFIPARTFSGPSQQAEFVKEIHEWLFDSSLKSSLH